MKKVPIILLTQCYNEEKNIKEFLENVSTFVDGIIVLDDGSTDNSWNLLNHEKILLKFKKKRSNFNDLENRNLLLHLLQENFIKKGFDIQWIIWLDFDERIYGTVEYQLSLRNKLLSSNGVKQFYLFMVHMWDNENYNSTYPGSYKGIQNHLRIIRNDPTLKYKIQSNQKLHFKLTFYTNEPEHPFPMLVKHLGRNSPELRLSKYNLYTKIYDLDHDQKEYNHFINEPKLTNFESVVDIIIRRINKY
uniref:Glycosyltransferase 2-like domain-containing protein n=1 Tax=viral metagenome TaxID=1070528 RepID=A0A6C0I9A4_9ZZZZ